MRRSTLIILLCAIVFASAGPAAGSDITLSSTRPRQGEIVKITVHSPGCPPTITWQGESIPLIKRNDRRIGFFGVGLETKPGVTPLRLGENCAGVTLPDQVDITVRDGDFPVQRLTIEDTGKVQLSRKALRRHRRESRKIDAALARRTDKRYWNAPFHPPVTTDKFSPNNSFGSRRIINGHPRSPHSGEDYAADVGDPIYAINRGVVSLTGDFFFSGKGIFVDHGHGLTSMYFHLSEISVEDGEMVRAGERIGSAGATGRVTGPHLHLGVQWRSARIDPDALFFDQAGLFRP